MSKSESTTTTESAACQDEEAGLADEECEELTEEEKVQLGRILEDTHRTGRTPLLDALLPEKDWPEEELLDIYRGEVARRLKMGAQAMTDDVARQFNGHVERSFQRGRSEAQCAALWLTRLS